MGFITQLQLSQFRCYETARLENLVRGPVVLCGPNGAGKTNVLEAVSFLTPGRGMRGAKMGELQRRDAGAMQGWAVSALTETPYGPARIGIGRDALSDKRIVRINGETAKAQSILSEYLACVWLTPQMDRLFLDAAGSRRRFLDRLVFAFDPAHAGRVTRYENAMSQRAKILKEHENPDERWLDGLEAAMAETGVAIAAARQDFMQRLQTACDRATADENNLFPRAQLAVRGTIEELLAHAPAVEVEDMFRYQLTRTRQQDGVTGGSATGPHKSDLVTTYAAKDMPADQCSTGEQKALLIGIILAHARLIAAERGAPPILLLDEVAAHLDETRRAGLYEILLATKGQVWLTGTDAALFNALSATAQFYHVQGAALHEMDARADARFA
jgi:DNA replication and repair protein RecF